MSNSRRHIHRRLKAAVHNIAGTFADGFTTLHRSRAASRPPDLGALGLLQGAGAGEYLHATNVCLTAVGEAPAPRPSGPVKRDSVDSAT